MADPHPPSWYAATANPHDPFPALDGDRRADVCIIGGGYTGLSAALHLAEAGITPVLLEANSVGWGASGRNGGQVGSGQRVSQLTLEAQVGDADAQKLWQAAEAAKALVYGLVQRFDIACDLQKGILHPVHKKRYEAEAHAYASHLRERYGYEAITPLSADAMRDLLSATGYYGGDLDRGAGHLHPLNYARGLADAARKAGADVHENTRVLSVSDGAPCRVATATGTVTADWVIVACNGYLAGLIAEADRHLFPINNFISVTEPLDDPEALIRHRYAVADSRFVVYYFRMSADNRLIFGGGESYGRRFPADIAGFVRPHMERIFPQLKRVNTTHSWGGTLAITRTRQPYFARPRKGVLVMGGYSGHGVAMATLSGQIAAEAVGGTMARFDLFQKLPTPAFPGGPALRGPAQIAGMLWYKLRDFL